MKVIICGGRKFRDWEGMCKALDAINEVSPFDMVIEGGAPGADTLARSWAESRRIKVKEVLAMWSTYGKKAGHLRNKRMLDMLSAAEGDYVIAFPGGTGTDGMKKLARDVGFNIVEYF